MGEFAVGKRAPEAIMKSIRSGLSIALLLACTTLAHATSVHRLQFGGVNLVVEMDGDIRAAEDGSPWTDWLANTLQASSTVTGSFPRNDVRIKISATSRSSSPIAFGQVRRTQPPQLRFYVSPEASLEQLKGDWRGYHEFAHLLIPFPGNDDIWFTEGFASYYQYLIQSRAGVISQRQAWQQLLDGFRRGETDRSGRGRTLRSLSPNMWHERAHKRVYWTGAAFFLRIDIRLRTESAGRHSLDSALAAFHTCCMESRRRWSARQLVEALGEVSIAEIWRQEYLRTINGLAEPHYDKALDKLGIRRLRSSLLFNDSESMEALRHAIAGPRQLPADFDRVIRPDGAIQAPASPAP